jgi:spore photoproduct lyase
MKPGSFIRQVVVEDGATNHPVTQKILKDLEGTFVSQWKGAQSGSGEQDMGKQTLRLISYRGEFLKPCPGTKEYICCGYQILNLATNCPLECSYCILQSYLNQPDLRVYVNLERRIEQVMEVIDLRPHRIFRVGTGEFTDSLALDPIARWTDLLVPLFSSRKNAILEFKTKTVNIRNLLACKDRDRIVVSWSLNSPYISAREEHGAAGLRQRLEAARQCQNEGFILGFHFDPLIPHPNWQEEYAKTLELMDRYVDPKGIIWISLGSFRFPPHLKSIIRRRHPKTCALDGEFIKGLDGKMRYFKPIRLDLYSFMRENLEKWSRDVGLYLCMESDDVWERSLGWSTGDSAGLCHYLDNRVLKIFG